MIALRPFFLLIGRPSVFWLGAIGLSVLSLIVAGFVEADARVGLYVDAVIIAAFGFPAFAGWLAGAAIQEFQHTSFANLLPGVRSRIAPGFLITGVAVAAIVTGSIALASGTQQNLPALFVVGLAAYCLGAIVNDPLSVWVTSFNVVLVLFVIAKSRDMGRFASDHPWPTAAVSLGLAALCVLRLFARSTFRRKPSRSTSPLPGSFSFEKTRQQQVRRSIGNSPRKAVWHAGYLGDDPWRWVRAAIHETHGPRGVKAVAKAIGRAWGVIALILLYAWLDKGDMAFGEALARSVNDALFRSPHQPQFGEQGGPYALVAMGLAAAGVITALFTPVALGDAIAYPLSRRQRAQVLFRGGLVDAGIFLFIVAPCLYAIGHLTGWLVGFESRFDFMPFFFRVLMVTLILMPLAHRGRLGLQAATRQKAEHTMLGVIFGITGFVIAVCVLTFVSPRLFGPPALELAALTGALVVSQLLYRRTLMSYHRTADLA